jgi:hypothetical protein
VPTLADRSFPADRGRVMRAALAVPDTSPPRGAVIVLHEALGLNDDIRGIASRFAANGYLAMAPDFLDTGGPRVLCLARFMGGVGKAGGRPYRDLEAARRWLVEQREAVGVARNAWAWWGSASAVGSRSRTPPRRSARHGGGSLLQRAATRSGRSTRATVSRRRRVRRS